MNRVIRERLQNDFIAHHGVKGQKWYHRRYQNEDGSLTLLGRVHYGIGAGRKERRAAEKAKKLRDKRLRQASKERAKNRLLKKQIIEKADVESAYKNRHLFSEEELANIKRRKDVEETFREQTSKYYNKTRRDQAKQARREAKEVEKQQRRLKEKNKRVTKERESTEKKREDLIKNGSAKDILKNKGLFTDEELVRISRRLQSEKTINDLNYDAGAFKKGLDYAKTAVDTIGTVNNAYDNVQKLIPRINAIFGTDLKELPKLGGGDGKPKDPVSKIVSGIVDAVTTDNKNKDIESTKSSDRTIDEHKNDSSDNSVENNKTKKENKKGKTKDKKSSSETVRRIIDESIVRDVNEVLDEYYEQKRQRDAARQEQRKKSSDSVSKPRDTRGEPENQSFNAETIVDSVYNSLGGDWDNYWDDFDVRDTKAPSNKSKGSSTSTYDWAYNFARDTLGASYQEALDYAKEAEEDGPMWLMVK